MNYSQGELSDLVATEPQLVNTNKLVAEGGSGCAVEWQDAVFGTCIGQNNSLLPIDLNGDGRFEIIASANGGNNTSFWYVLSYDEASNDYTKIYTSPPFSNRISKMVLLDLNADGKQELAFGSGKEIFLIDLSDYSVINNMIIAGVTSFNGITQIRYADADNNGTTDLLIGSNSRLHILNPETLEVEHSISISNQDVAIGNVDDDAANEIVFTHGLAIQVSPDGSFVEEYDFLPNAGSANGFIELADIDGDNREEAIIANAWYRINTYEVELESPKFEIESNLDIDALLVQDVNGDNVKDIVYGDGQWGKIYGHNGLNGHKLWETDNPEHGTTGIAIAQLDDDERIEIIWGAGCSSTGADYLFVHALDDRLRKWKSEHIDGPFYALEVADVDADGQQEIVAISYESESGYDSGVLTIYDALTKEIEFRSDGEFFYNAWNGIFNLEIADYANDGDLDIIVATGATYDGKMYVVDGRTHVIEKEREFTSSDDIEEFYNLEVTDLNNDGQLEYIAATEEKLYVLNGVDFSVEWQSITLGNSRRPTGILTGNLDDDEGIEMVLCKQSVYRFDDEDYQQNQTVASNYSAIQLYDWDGDGSLEILAGTNGGDIHILDGTSLAVIANIAAGEEAINGILLTDLNDDGVDEILASSDQQIHFINREGNIVGTQPIAAILGSYDAMKFVDSDGDGNMNLLLGTAISIIELNPGCAACLWFAPELSGRDPLCDSENGVLFANQMTTDSISYRLNDELSFIDSLGNLAAGTYTVTASNSIGCAEEIMYTLNAQRLVVGIDSSPRGCDGTDNGQLIARITEGQHPFSFNWSDGTIIDTLSDLAAGSYRLTITDGNGCIDSVSSEVGQLSLETELNLVKPACEGITDGIARIHVTNGIGPYTYDWGNNINGPFNNALAPGINLVLITDSRGCTSSHNFAIDSVRLEITAEQLSVSCNGNDSGTAEVQITEGQAPYYINWPTINTTLSTARNLSPGSYPVTVRDGNNCISVDTAVVSGSELEIVTSGTNNICFDGQEGEAEVTVVLGVPPYSYQWTTGETTRSVFGLERGNYGVRVIDSVGCSIVKPVVIESPPEISINFIIDNDNAETTAPDGSIVAEVSGGTPPYFFNWVDGGTIDSLSGLTAGLYELVVTDINQCQIVDSANVEIVTRTQNPLTGALAIFPNPVKDELSVTYSLPVRLQLTVFDGHGRRMYTTEFKNSGQANFSHLPAAVYHVRVMELTTGRFVTRRVVKR